MRALKKRAKSNISTQKNKHWTYLIQLLRLMSPEERCWNLEKKTEEHRGGKKRKETIHELRSNTKEEEEEEETRSPLKSSAGGKKKKSRNVTQVKSAS